MQEFLQQMVNGIAWGSIYALIALGYTMVYGILRFINFAHGDVFMVGAFLAYYAVMALGFTTVSGAASSAGVGGFLLVLFLAMAGSALLGVVIERLAYKPVRRQSRLTALITA